VTTDVIAAAAETGAAAEERISVATQRQLMWWRFRKNKLAMVGAVVVALFYLFALFADFFAYSSPYASDAQHTLVPPQGIHWFDGGFHPYVHPVTAERDPETFRLRYVIDESEKVRVRFFAHGYSYRVLGLIETDIHLIGVEGGEPESVLFLMGTDVQGRDLFSRLVIATRTSLTIGLVGLAISLMLGIVFGGLSGYYGGATDTVIQRIIEVIGAIPAIPLWLGLAAALPNGWSVYQVYFAITLIISLFAWRSLAREIRGRILSVRSEDYVTAADLAGCSTRRILRVHLLPSCTSHIIATATLALPAMVTAETALSFLGLGLRAPAISWGVLLHDAQSIQSVALSPWLMLPAVPLVLIILAFNALGDGLRDAADPYAP
jgi:peptide/nickel transport system permease protein